MISGTQTYIRFSEPDDATFIRRLYLEPPRRAALLDARREPLSPTLQDVRQILARNDAAQGMVFTVEDTTGQRRGWCGLRGITIEARFAEMTLLFADTADYDSALADEALDFLAEKAFLHYRLHKTITLCLEEEAGLRAFLERNGFVRAGTQREALYSGGRWHDLHTYVLTAGSCSKTQGKGVVPS